MQRLGHPQSVRSGTSVSPGTRELPSVLDRRHNQERDSVARLADMTREVWVLGVQKESGSAVLLVSTLSTHEERVTSFFPSFIRLENLFNSLGQPKEKWLRGVIVKKNRRGLFSRKKKAEERRMRTDQQRRHSAGPGSQAVNLMGHMSLLTETSVHLSCPVGHGPTQTFKDGMESTAMLLPGHPQTSI